jgi:hypothetical protein
MWIALKCIEDLLEKEKNKAQIEVKIIFEEKDK